MRKTLSICLPTFSRASFAEKQLLFILTEVQANPDLLQKVEILVGDNASTDDTVARLSRHKNSAARFSLFTNKKNLGLVGNLWSLLEHATGEFVWFVSDDDELKQGVVERIIGLIESQKNIHFIFLNFYADNQPGVRSVSGFFADARSAALKAFEEAYGALVLITACVHRRSNLNVIARLKMKDWIGIPLLWSLYGCATGPAFFSKAPWVTFRQGHASYSGFSRELEIKFEEYIPILESLRDYGYDTADIKASISHFLKTQSHALTLYFVMNPRKAIRLTRYLSIGVVLSIPRNAFHYVKRRYL